MVEIRYKPIGVIHSPFTEPKGVPIQSAVACDVDGTIEILPEYVEGLKDVEGFSHIILIYHFHLSRESTLLVRPYLDDQERGVFATRSPSRPNAIGLSTVRLLRIEGNLLYVKDVDVVDGTPLLDMKPYVPEFDARHADRIGWLKEKLQQLPILRDDGRFAG
ncbi:MAG: tRNA (N6-threonylcarbamoyladenosine(37)-N6)-methyltransferase TrmO [Chloroflexi bacterium]|nr:tRNA (N6-threonylcarbamoyladenosine(37)-N6)-methyltransferase TrmO [Chloroflexota bacterium]